MAEETEDVKIEEVETPEVKDSETEKPETRESVVSKIGGMIKSHFSGKDESEEEAYDVPTEFANTVQGLGWTDEEVLDFILEDGKPIYSDEELLEMLPILRGENPAKAEEISDKVKPETPKNEDNNSQEDEKIKKLLDRIDALEKAQGERKESDKKQEVSNLVNRAEQMFDNTSKEFEVFGVTEKLPKFPDGRLIPNSPQMKARQEVWDIGMKLYMSGVDFDTAMSVSLNAYKGKNLGKTIERNVIKELKNREKKLSGKRINHESSQPDLSGPELIGKILEERGKK